MTETFCENAMRQSAAGKVATGPASVGIWSVRMARRAAMPVASENPRAALRHAIILSDGYESTGGISSGACRDAEVLGRRSMTNDNWRMLRAGGCKKEGGR